MQAEDNYASVIPDPAMSDSQTPRFHKAVASAGYDIDAERANVYELAAQLERELAARDAELSAYRQSKTLWEAGNRELADRLEARDALIDSLREELADRASIRCANCHANPDLECEPLKTCRAELAEARSKWEIAAGLYERTVDSAIERAEQAEARAAANEKDAQKWKERAEYEYSLRVYPFNPGLAVGALDAAMKTWQWKDRKLDIDAAMGGRDA